MVPNTIILGSRTGFKKGRNWGIWTKNCVDGKETRVLSLNQYCSKALKYRSDSHYHPGTLRFWQNQRITEIVNRSAPDDRNKVAATIAQHALSLFVRRGAKPELKRSRMLKEVDALLAKTDDDTLQRLYHVFIILEDAFLSRVLEEPRLEQGGFVSLDHVSSPLEKLPIIEKLRCADLLLPFQEAFRNKTFVAEVYSELCDLFLCDLILLCCDDRKKNTMVPMEWLNISTIQLNLC